MIPSHRPTVENSDSFSKICVVHYSYIVKDNTIAFSIHSRNSWSPTQAHLISK